MTFVPAARIEARASELWYRHHLTPGFDVEQLLDDLGLDLLWEEVADDAGGRLLGQLVPADNLVVLNERHKYALEKKQGRLRRYTVGHEVGHWELHSEAIRSKMISLFDGTRTWCRDGSQDPIERQAEMFSAALLMPKDELRAAVHETPWRGWRTVYRLADLFVVNVTPMTIRLETLGWMHRDPAGQPIAGSKPIPGQDSLFS